jgi:hypothetical protein
VAAASFTPAPYAFPSPTTGAAAAAAAGATAAVGAAASPRGGPLSQLAISAGAAASKANVNERTKRAEKEVREMLMEPME